MAEVVDLRPPKPEPHNCGTARCVDCGSEWPFVAPVGTTTLECPQCKTFRGMMVGLCDGADGEGIWTCGCGCDVFKIVAKDGRYKWTICIRCGTPQNF